MVFKADTEFYDQLTNTSTNNTPDYSNIPTTKEPIYNLKIETLIATELFIVIIAFALYKFIANKKNRSEQQSKSKKDDSHNTGENDNEQEYQQRQPHKEQSGKKIEMNEQETKVVHELKLDKSIIKVMWVLAIALLLNALSNINPTITVLLGESDSLTVGFDIDD